MSRFAKRQLCWIAGVLVAGGAADAHAPTQLDTVRLAQQLTRIAFAELADGRYEVVVTTNTQFADDWTRAPFVGVSLRAPGQSHHPEPKAANLASNLLEGFFYFRGRQIEIVNYRGRHVHSREVQLLAERAEANPAWDDADMASALRDAGAKFGPGQRDEFLRMANLQRYTPVLGRVQRSNARFSWRIFPGEPDSQVIQPCWRVSIEAEEPGGATACYHLAFEPIDGRLIRVLRRECDVSERE